jgi:transposase
MPEGEAMAVVITREEHTAEGLRGRAAAARTPEAARRMLALAFVLEGWTRARAAAACGMERQTLRDWVHRYNAEGIEGLYDRVPAGPSPRLTAAQEAELAGIVERGPEPERDGVVRWRQVDLRRVIEKRYGVSYHERSVGKLLARLGFAHISARAVHPAADRAAQEAFKKTSPRW